VRTPHDTRSSQMSLLKTKKTANHAKAYNKHDTGGWAKGVTSEDHTLRYYPTSICEGLFLFVLKVGNLYLGIPIGMLGIYI
jgi:hypothetical protein